MVTCFDCTHHTLIGTKCIDEISICTKFKTFVKEEMDPCYHYKDEITGISINKQFTENTIKQNFRKGERNYG